MQETKQKTEQERLVKQINFPNTETREQKLARKAKARDMFYRSTGEKLVLANLSKSHVDYGMTPAEHLRAKANRLAEVVL